MCSQTTIPRQTGAAEYSEGSNNSAGQTGGYSASPDAGKPNHARPSLLIVDDNQANLDMLSRRLQRKGYHVMTADSAHGARELMKKSSFDLLLLDINMPDMNGYEFCSWLKTIDDLKEIPVIFLSALTETIDKVRAFDCGGVDYLTKPIQMEELYVRVDTHLQLRQMRLELESKNEDLRQALDKLRTAQSQLIQSAKLAALGVLTAGLAHEINNPVNFIIASARGLDQAIRQICDINDRYERIDPERAVAEIERINRFKQEMQFGDLLCNVDDLIKNITTGSERIAEIVKGLGGFSRLDNSEKVIVDIHGIIDSVLVILRHKLGESIVIRKDYDDIPPVRGYPGRLDQVIMNLLVNAIDATYSSTKSEKQGTIRIVTRAMVKDGRSVVAIAVADTGPGITDVVKAHLFEPFFTTKDVGKGTGLGLAISLGIVESHGGTIGIESVPGEGATFTVYLPSGDAPDTRKMS